MHRRRSHSGDSAKAWGPRHHIFRVMGYTPLACCASYILESREQNLYQIIIIKANRDRHASDLFRLIERNFLPIGTISSGLHSYFAPPSHQPCFQPVLRWCPEPDLEPGMANTTSSGSPEDGGGDSSPHWQRLPWSAKP